VWKIFKSSSVPLKLLLVLLFVKCKYSHISSMSLLIMSPNPVVEIAPFVQKPDLFLDNAHKHKGAQYNINFSLLQDLKPYLIIYAQKGTAKHICLFNNSIYQLPVVNGKMSIISAKFRSTTRLHTAYGIFCDL
jgi:hypothetical protein